ncbi:hypothetical protein [Anaerotruncus colihominis]|uniref:GerMN domain-containing protein n=1 Tax=Anaerotruncus colihominis TaxID=169435 RepID=A0A845SSW5_9FIRM|nr:hypothetical protein [Anaerotruncus colihominis]MCR2024995.1 hypothetical protein [Anaerotruncus colihominis]NDO40159.1 hypothetical protein [Anaerotruncus colihominis]
MKQFAPLILAAVLAVSLAACTDRDTAAPSSSASAGAVSSAPHGQSAPEQAPSASSAQTSSAIAGMERTLYIGAGPSMKEYPWTFESDPSPDGLIAAIAETTGWNLTLAEPVSSGRGGMTVVFGRESSVFTGPPDPQKDEFHVFDTQDLVFHILDSIQKTLQMNTIDPALGDPDNLDIYFSTEDGAISLPDVGIEIPLEEPYPGSAALSEAYAQG